MFVSGTAPHDPATGAIKGATVQEQTRQCLTNIAAILEAAGSSMDKIVSVTIVLADEDDFAGMNEEYLRVVSVRPAGAPGREAAGAYPGAEGVDRGDRARRERTRGFGRRRKITGLLAR